MSVSMTAPLALITGASRGLGLETARQLGARGYRLAIAARDEVRLAAAHKELASLGHDVRAQTVDMAYPPSVSALGHWAVGLGPLACLVNAAGILPGQGHNESVLAAREDDVSAAIAVNALGPWRLVRAVAAGLADNATIVNVSSGLGALTDMGGGYFAYRASKTMLNVLTRTLAAELAPRGIMVNSVCPGWVKTDMGGPNATRTIAEGASGIVWAATLKPGGPTGGFFRDGKTIDW